MSDVNLPIRNSTVIRHNLVILGESRVEGQNLILDDGSDFIYRFAPEIMNENETMDALYGTQRDEFESFNADLHSVIDNNFIQSLDLKGIQKWEKILKLESNSSLSINVRQDLISLKRLFRPPFTRQNLQRILESIWGDGNYTFELYPNEFELIIDIFTSEPEIYLKFQRYIRNLVPANMYVIFAVQYTYLYLFRNFTYNNLSSLTYGELSRYS